MKKFLILIILLNYLGVFSQDLEIQLDIEKIKKKNVLNIGGLKSKNHIEVPYLYITYKNLSNKNIYFKKINNSQKTECFQNVLASKIFENFHNDLEKNLKKDTSNSYKAFMDHKPLDDYSLFDIENTKSIEKHGKGYITVAPLREKIEGQFNTLMEVIHFQNLLNKYNPDIQLEYFKYQGKKKISILEAEKWLYRNDFVKIENIDNLFNYETLSINVSLIKNNFIFLKKGESYTEKVSLISLKLLGQNFEFDFRELKFHDYEERYDLDINENLRFYYPKSIDGYTPVDENSVIIFIPLKVKL